MATERYATKSEILVSNETVAKVLSLICEPDLECSDCTPCVCDPKDPMQGFCTSSEYGVCDGAGAPIDNHSIAEALSAVAKAQMILGVADYKPGKILDDTTMARKPDPHRERRVEQANMMRVLSNVHDYLGELIRDNLVEDTPRASDLADDVWDAIHGGIAPKEGEEHDSEDVQRLIIACCGSERLSLVIDHKNDAEPAMYEVFSPGKGKLLFFQYKDALARYNMNIEESKRNG